MKMLHKLLPHKGILGLSHHNTLFSQTLSLIPRHLFQKLENRHKTGRSLTGPKITAADIGSSLRGYPAGQALFGREENVPDNGSEEFRAFTLDEAADRYIQEVLTRNGGNKSLTARILGISREGLRMKLARTNGNAGIVDHAER